MGRPRHQKGAGDMALKPCRECGEQVSTEAKTCPHCGVKRPVKQTSVFAWIILAVIGLGFVSAVLSESGFTATK